MGASDQPATAHASPLAAACSLVHTIHSTIARRSLQSGSSSPLATQLGQLTAARFDHSSAHTVRSTIASPAVAQPDAISEPTRNCITYHDHSTSLHTPHYSSKHTTPTT